MQHYTYIHKTNDGSVFYVGKGRGRRAWVHSGRNRSQSWRDHTKAHGLQVELCGRWETELEAFEHEKFLIAFFKDMGFVLLNKTNGGGGAGGMKQSKESNALRSAALLGRKRPADVGVKIAERLKGRSRDVIPEIEAKRVAAAIAAKSKPVVCVDTGRVFPSLTEAARELGKSIAPISMALSGKRQTAHGFQWRFA